MGEPDPDEDLKEDLTPRVGEALVRAARVEDEEGLLQETLGLEVWTSWDVVQDKMKKMSLPNLDFILQPCGMKPAPGSGIVGRVDLAIEYLKGLAKQTRATIREEERQERLRREAEFAKANRDLCGALRIQSWWRARVPRQQFLDHMRATANTRRARKQAEEIAKKWQRTGPPPDTAVVWLHDRGESEASYRHRLGGIAGASCRWVWPRAPLAPGGVRQWFETPELPVCSVVRGVPDRPRRGEQAEDVAAAVDRVHVVLASLEVEGVPADRVLLGGCGQGAALAAHAALRYPRALAGVALVSAWVPCQEELAAAATPEGRSCRFLWCHGAADAVVQPAEALAHRGRLQELGVHVDFALLPALRRGLDREVVDALRSFIAERLPEGPARAGAAISGG